MVLEQIRACRLLYEGDSILVIGTCKRCNKRYTVTLTLAAFEEWKGGIPLAYVADLTKKEINFLTTGIWREANFLEE